MRYQQINAFPSVILHDCSIRRVFTRERDLVVDLDDFGFFVKVPEQDNYFRTGPARLIFTCCDPDDLEIKEVRTHHLTEDQFFDSMYDVSPQEVARRVNEGSVHLTFLEEYYLPVGLFCAVCAGRRREPVLFAGEGILPHHPV